ncbi:MAG: HEAT repeat domain-containing protein [Verrucomicrobiota bacterium]
MIKYIIPVLTLTFVVAHGFVLAQETDRLDEILEELKNYPVNAKEAQTAHAVGLLKEVGAMGSDAAKAVPLLLSEDFFLIKGGYTAKDNPLRLATIDALVKIGEPAVPAVMEMLEMPQGRNKFQWKDWGRIILKQMAQTDSVDVIISTLAENLKSSKQKNETYQLLASLGPASVPTLREVARTLAAKDNLSKADANELRRLGNLLGGEVGSAIDAVFPERYTEETWENDRYWIHYRGGWYPLAQARPGPQHIPALLDLIRNEALNKTRYYEGVRYVGMILSTMSDAPIAPLAETLKDPNPETRWAAAFILAMFGQEARAAVPALQESFENEDEAIEVRVAAARAIGTITNTESAALYQRIPQLQERLVAATRERSRFGQSEEAWKAHFASSTTDVRARQLALYNRTPQAEKPIFDLALGDDLEAANQWVREFAQAHLTGEIEAKSFGDGKMSEDLNLFLHLFGRASRHFPGRLEADVEQAAKEYGFRSVDILPAEHHGKPRYIPKSSDDLDQILALDESICIAEFTNGPLRSDAQHYLILQILQNDPAFRDRRFKTGDTVSERYERFTSFFQRGLKEWALHGMWVELGSSNYEYKTYRGLFLLLDFAKDPVVAARARMLMDLALIEIEQISISGLRGGSKSRAKDGGLDSRFNRYLAMLYGEHHGYMLEPPGFEGYRPPVPAVLLRRLGPTEKTYEIINRHPGETIVTQGPMTQGNGFHITRSRSVNYAWCTPEYVTGSSMFDVRFWPEVEKTRKNRKNEIQTYMDRQFGYAPLGRWSGVIFRDASAVFLEAYTGEKWNLQSGDVMVAQRFPDSYYAGDAKVDFVGSLKIEEEDGWVFVDNDDAYAAVRIARGGYNWNEPARQQLYLQDQYSPILIQTGRRAVYESFEGFQNAILAAPLTITGDALDFTGPNSSRIEFFLCKDLESFDEAYPQSLPQIDGVELDLNLTHNYQSPYLNNEVGSDVVTVSYGDRVWEYDFANNTVTEK